MKQKFYAERFIVLNGRDYNPGEIVWHENKVAGLRPADEERQPEKARRPRAPISDFLGRENPEVSVIITFHDQREFTGECLEGFVRQTIKKPYEIIAIVDASTDGTAEFIKKNFPRVKIEEVDYKQANRGRNHGLRLARGKYVAFMDGDDYPFGEYLEKLYNEIEAHPEAGFIYARFENKIYGLEKSKLPRCNIFEWTDSWCDFSNITNTPILIRRADAPGWDEELEIMQDAGYCLAAKAKGLKGRHVREKLWFYRIHPKGLWAAGNIHGKHERAMKILKEKFNLRTDSAKVLFVSLISRDEVLDEYFKQIPSLGLEQAHWLVFIDSDDEIFIEKVKAMALKLEKLFLSIRVFATGEKNLAQEKSFEPRGMRIAGFIAAIINQARERIGGAPFLFMVEDDTIAPKNAYKKLKKIITKNKNIAYASGVECGRGFTKHTGVCWLKEDANGEIIGREIPMIRKSGVEKIGGGGWYCWVGRTKLLEKFLLKNKFRCYDGKMLGPDVCMVHDLNKMGFDCVADFGIKCQHYDNRRRNWIQAENCKGYDIEYFIENKLWKMKLTEKKAP